MTNTSVTLFLIAIDFILISAAQLLGWWLRFSYNIFSVPYPSYISLSAYLAIIPLLSLFWIFSQSIMGAYRLPAVTKISMAVAPLLKAAGISVLLISAASFVLRNHSYSRLALAYSSVLAILFIMAARTIFIFFQRFCLRWNMFVTSVVLAGDRDSMNCVEDKLKSNPWVAIAARATENSERENDLIETAFKTHSKDVLVCYPHFDWPKIRNIIEQCVPAGINVRVISDYLSFDTGTLSLVMMDGIPVLHFSYGLLEKWNRTLKRGLDIILAVILSAVAAPFAAIISLLIVLDSPGPAFFTQRRTGRGGEKFKMLKFRSMRAGSEKMLNDLHARNNATFPIFKIIDDPRITGMGRFLRRYYLDELPQLWNVIKGDMSLVGPRPLPEYEEEKLAPEQKKRYIVPPGITGLWQVTPSAHLSAKDMFTLDMRYIERWSITADLAILLRTLPLIISRQGK